MRAALRRRGFLGLFPLALASGSATVSRRLINKTDGNYSQAVEISGFKRLVLVSGQVGEDENGHVPATFREQALLAWANVSEQLKAAGMGVSDIVKMTLFLSDRRYRGEAYQTRHEVLGEHAPAMTIIICGIYRESWLLEIEVMAAG